MATVAAQDETATSDATKNAPQAATCFVWKTKDDRMAAFNYWSLIFPLSDSPPENLWLPLRCYVFLAARILEFDRTHPRGSARRLWEIRLSTQCLDWAALPSPFQIILAALRMRERDGFLRCHILSAQRKQRSSPRKSSPRPALIDLARRRFSQRRASNTSQAKQERKREAAGK